MKDKPLYYQSRVFVLELELPMGPKYITNNEVFFEIFQANYFLTCAVISVPY